MSAQLLLTPATDAGTITLDTRNYYRVTVVATALATTETVTASVVIDDSTRVPAKDEAGAAATCNATTGTMVLVGGPVYYLNKSATAASSGVYFIPCSNN